jgi:hypothetical protein
MIADDKVWNSTIEKRIKEERSPNNWGIRMTLISGSGCRI